MVTEEIRLKGTKATVQFDHEPEEPATVNKPRHPEQYEIISINGIDPDWFKPEIIAEIIEQLDREAKEKRKL